MRSKSLTACIAATDVLVETYIGGEEDDDSVEETQVEKDLVVFIQALALLAGTETDSQARRLDQVRCELYHSQNGMRMGKREPLYFFSFPLITSLSHTLIFFYFFFIFFSCASIFFFSFFSTSP